MYAVATTSSTNPNLCIAVADKEKMNFAMFDVGSNPGESGAATDLCFANLGCQNKDAYTYKIF